MAVSDSPEERDPAKGFAAGCFECVEELITAFIAVLLLFVFLFRLNIVVVGPSMEPNYREGYRVFVSCLDRNFTTGDVVVVDADGTRLKERIIKRVIATGGQTVDIDFDTGVVSVDGKPLDESAYIRNGITKDRSDVSFPCTVPAGHVFVLGDNRTVSEDSRSSYVGMIDSRFVLGRVLFTLSPFHGFTAA